MALNEPITGQSNLELRTSIFVSHHVATHKKCAERIKQILESRSEWLDVHICEAIVGGENWHRWIAENIAKSKLLLILLPNSKCQMEWIEKEVESFKKCCPNGFIVVIRSEAQAIPGFAADLEVVDSSQEDLQTRFLDPLYRQTTYTRLGRSLNPRISDLALTSDAYEIRKAILGESRVHEYGSRINVDMNSFDVATSGLQNALVYSSDGFGRILNWDRPSFSWSELQQRAEIDRGKGTFWVHEMEVVIQEIAQQCQPRVMSSTFRGRGEAAGRIFRPQLTKVEKVGEKPISFEFAFYEVLSPELVRGPEILGAVYSLLRLVSRVRWEVLNPLVKSYLGGSSLPSAVHYTPEEQQEIIGRVSNSLRTIELEAERHDIIAQGLGAFKSNERDLIEQMLHRRDHIRAAIDDAVKNTDFEKLMEELIQSLDLNIQVMPILADKFYRLTEEDRFRVKEQMKGRLAPAAKTS